MAGYTTAATCGRSFTASLAGSNLADLAQIDESIESGTYTRTDSQHIEPTSRRGTRT